MFYPVIFTIGSIVLFIISSRIDELFYKNIEFDNPYIGSLIFSGDADASRNILSAISTGWTTILGVAFSVTLITLQLSTSKYTSHLVNKFENDKINQLTLAWFVSVVLFSLLVLKTVRTGGDGGGGLHDADVFTPIRGVNIPILLAGVALFIFVAFLHNIASYLRPNILISEIVGQIIESLEPFKKRIEYNVKRDKSRHKDKDGLFGDIVVFELRSNQKGIYKSIQWEKIYKILQELSKQNNDSLWMQWYKALGDHIEKGDIIAVIYSYDDSNHSIKNNDQGNITSQNANNNNKADKNKPDINHKSFNKKLISHIAISKDRNISSDPSYGIELLRSLAVKSTNQSDTDVVGSCIASLFEILRNIADSTELLGVPFTLENPDTKKHSSSSNSTSPSSNSPSSIRVQTLTIINPKETKLSDSILFDLSLILEKAASNNQVTVIKYFINDFIALSRFLLESNRLDEFHRITKWCAEQLSTSFKPFQKQFQGQMIIDLINFKKELIITYPKMANIFEKNMEVILNNELESHINTSIGR